MNIERQKPCVALVTHSLDWGGSPLSLWNLARKLTDWKRIVISEKEGPLREQFESAGCVVHVVPRTGFMQLGLTRRLAGLFRQERVSLVHLNTLTSYYKYAAIAARLKKIPVVWFIREDVREKRCRKLFWWIKTLADRIVPVSQEISANLYPAGAPAKVCVIYNGIEMPPVATASAALRDALKLSPTTPLIGCVAALEPRKGVEDLIKAFAEVVKQFSNAHLVCLGKDRSRDQHYRRQLESLISQLGLASQIHLLGEVANPIGAYREFDLFVLPTHWEGCARTLLEAMLQKCPVITTVAGGNPEVIQHQNTGWLVPPGDPAALASAIQTLLKDRSAARNLAEAAHADWLKRFTLDRHVENVLAVYQAALKADR